ncbi:MAG: T9SS type A sorting domain-containing protein, partial [Bacteroidota bacterium]
LTSRGWETAQSTTTNAVLTRSPGLEYTGYIGSGIGNATSLTTTGQDVYKEFAVDSAGSFYTFFMLRVTAARSGDYFFHYHTSPVSSSYFGRTFVRTAANGNLSFGIAKKGTNSNPTSVYTDSIYHLETTYVIVVKYTFREGSNQDDEVSLFLFSDEAVPMDEPAHPTVGPVTDETTDAKKIGAIALRQGSTSSSPEVVIDGFRVGRSWASALPITLSSFHARLIQTGLVQLEWRTESEIDNYGFVVQRSAGPEQTFEEIPNGFVPGNGTTSLPSQYTFVDTLPSEGKSWLYRLKQIDMDGSIHLSEVVTVDILSHIREDRTSGGILSQNHPNPFNSESEFFFRPEASGPARVDMFNMLGQHVQTLFTESVQEGQEYRIRVRADRLPSGFYIYRLRTDGESILRKMLLLR